MPARPSRWAKWLLREDSPLLFRPRLDPSQWRWGLAFLMQCTTAAFERNVEELVQLGRYSHASLKELVARTGIEYDRLERGILHFFSSQADFDSGAAAAEIMRSHGVDRRVLNREEVLKVEPALAAFGSRIFGGTFTPSDESGDAKVFTQKLARLCAERGAQFLYEHDILALQCAGDGIESVQVAHIRSGERKTLKADAFVAAMGSYTPELVKPLGECLNIYPAKGYSATLRLKKPEAASVVSLLDDTRKIAISRLGDHIRIAGTAELSGFDLNLDSPTGQGALRGPGAALRGTLPRRGRHLGAQLLDRPAPQHADQHPLHRPQQEGAQSVDQCRPRHAGVDARRRLRPCDGRAHRRPPAGHGLRFLRRRLGACAAPRAPSASPGPAPAAGTCCPGWPAPPVRPWQRPCRPNQAGSARG